MNWILIQNFAAYAIMVTVFVNGARDIWKEIKKNRCSDFPTPKERG